MSAEGGQRKQSRGAMHAGTSTLAKHVLPPIPPRPSRWGKALLEYGGPSGMTIRGRISGEVYRFPSTGARAAVDVRDIPSLLASAQLRRV